MMRNEGKVPEDVAKVVNSGWARVLQQTADVCELLLMHQGLRRDKWADRQLERPHLNADICCIAATFIPPPHTTHYNNLNCLFIFWAPHPTVSSLAIQQHIKIYTKAHTHRRSLLVTRPLLTPFSNSQQHTPAASETSTRETERQTLRKGYQY